MTKTKLHTENEHLLRFQKGEIEIQVLGGLEKQSMTSLKVTLKANKEQYFLRHTLDLYDNKEVEYYVQKLAEALEIGTTMSRTIVHELTGELETYRETPVKPIQKPKGSDKQKSTSFLKQGNLIEQTNELIEEYGVVGENTNRILMYLVMLNCKQKHPLHILSYGNSGSGKTHLQNVVAELIPEHQKIESTAISQNALYYYNNGDLKNKIVLIEDLDGAKDSFYALRELQSRGKVTKTIAQRDSQGKTKAIQVTAEGPITLAGCTTKEELYEDNANRCFLIYIDESKEQDTRIMNYQKKIASGKVNEKRKAEIKTLFHNNMELLEPVKIINPYAELLDIPKNTLKPRRSICHYLHCIEAVTYYHQFQRKHLVNQDTGETYIESTWEDIEIANELMKEVLLQKTDSLPLATRRYLQRLKVHLEHKEEKCFTNRSLSIELRIPISTIKRYHGKLAQNGYIQKSEESTKDQYYYKLNTSNEYEVLQNNLNKVLNSNLLKIKGISGSISAHLTNEPPKVLKTNKQEAAAH